MIISKFKTRKRLGVAIVTAAIGLSVAGASTAFADPSQPAPSSQGESKAAETTSEAEAPAAESTTASIEAGNAKIIANGVVAKIPVTLTCDAEQSVRGMPTVEIRQNVGGHVAWSSAPVIQTGGMPKCTGEPQTFEVVLKPGDFAFTNGEAYASAKADFSDNTRASNEQIITIENG
ncbi:hypothetical protein ABT187_47325 [Streptomyces sp. NPDC001817]|uniref:hypothetical protein n=1 Tax=Streptomyces sp. NPDC001817 TaxID=3154398 RepID=UPI00332B22DF